MPAQDVVLGVDASTTGVKVIAWRQDGSIAAEGRAPLSIANPHPDYFEQPAEDWWRAFCQASLQCVSTLHGAPILGLSIAHQRETFVLTGKDGQPIIPAILWLDERAKGLLPDLADGLDLTEYQFRTGKPLTGNLSFTKLAWFNRHQPALLSQACRVMDTHSFLVWNLTDQFATAAGSADPTGLYDIPSGAWYEPACRLAGLDPAQLPRVLPPGAHLGRLTAEASRKTGLPVDLPVFAGLGDGQAASLALTAGNPGAAALSLGTSIITAAASPHYRVSPAFRTMTSGIPGQYVLEAVLLGGGFTISWLIDTFLEGRFSREELEKAAGSIPPGSEGLVLVPYWNSVMNPYWDATASGTVTGWRSHHRAWHLYRAAIEGIAMELRLHLEGIEAALGATIAVLNAAGGGTQNSLFNQIIAAVTGKPLNIPQVREATALGAGMLAGCGVGWYADTAAAAAGMAPQNLLTIQPDPRLVDFYDRLYQQVYRDIYPALRETQHRLSAISSNQTP